jgi:hypothetical protein
MNYWLLVELSPRRMSLTPSGLGTRTPRIGHSFVIPCHDLIAICGFRLEEATVTGPICQALRDVVAAAVSTFYPKISVQNENLNCQTGRLHILVFCITMSCILLTKECHGSEDHNLTLHRSHYLTPHAQLLNAMTIRSFSNRHTSVASER